ncbi:MAG: MFS transporter, partial [Verrucomicrobiota bacterium]
PSILWQIAAYALLTASEVMISITALEFAYKQSPKRMKSFIMCFYLSAVFFGNVFTSGVNKVIQIPELEPSQSSGYDQIVGTEDDLIFGEGSFVSSAATPILAEAVSALEEYVEEGDALPTENEAKPLFEEFSDPWGNPLRYELLNSNTARVSSDGPDEKRRTRWDLGSLITLTASEEEETKATWLERRKEKLGVVENTVATEQAGKVSAASYAGGQTRLEGAGYFWFFTWLMLGTSVLFLPVVRWFREEPESAS